MIIKPGRKVTVSLVDGSALNGVARLTWPWRLKISDVTVPHGAVPGVVYVARRAILTVQVVG